MAEIAENASGFKVLKISRAEIVEKLGPKGAIGVCDYCMKSPTMGYYVAVLDQWLCPECYQDFIAKNTPFPEDSHVESIMFNTYCRIFEVKINQVSPGAAK